MQHYDVIVIGSGPGGASLAQRLAATGKRILLMERGDYLPRSQKNWDSQTVFVDGAYQAPETWYSSDGDQFHPGLHYYVGGNSKVYGAALFRLRERDFGEIQHEDGISPAWPLKYDAFEPYYTQAETLFEVHGQRGESGLVRGGDQRAGGLARDQQQRRADVRRTARCPGASKSGRSSLRRQRSPAPA